MHKGLLIRRALDKWGAKKQLVMMIEECGEMIQATTKIMRKDQKEFEPSENFIEELVDLSLMIDQFKLFIPAKKLDAMTQKKLAKLNSLLVKSDD